MTNSRRSDASERCAHRRGDADAGFQAVRHDQPAAVGREIADATIEEYVRFDACDLQALTMIP